MPATAADSAGMSAEELKAGLRELLKQRGVLDEIKVQRFAPQRETRSV